MVIHLIHTPQAHSSQAVRIFYRIMHDTALGLALALVRLGAWEEFLPLRRPTCYDIFSYAQALIFRDCFKPRHRMVTSERLLYLTPVCDLSRNSYV